MKFIFLKYWKLPISVSVLNVIKNIKTGLSSIRRATSLLLSDRGADARTQVKLLIIRSELQIRNIELVFFCWIFAALLVVSV